MLEALGGCGDLLRGQEVDRREVPAAQLLGGARRVTEPSCSNVRSCTSPKPASASSRVERLGVGEAREVDRREVGQVRAEVVAREVLRRERPDEEPPLGREHAPRLRQRARPPVPSVWTTRRIVTASNQPLRNGRSSACAA